MAENIAKYRKRASVTNYYKGYKLHKNSHRKSKKSAIRAVNENRIRQ